MYVCMYVCMYVVWGAQQFLHMLKRVVRLYPLVSMLVISVDI